MRSDGWPYEPEIPIRSMRLEPWDRGPGTDSATGRAPGYHVLPLEAEPTLFDRCVPLAFRGLSRSEVAEDLRALRDALRGATRSEWGRFAIFVLAALLLVVLAFTSGCGR